MSPSPLCGNLLEVDPNGFLIWVFSFFLLVFLLSTLSTLGEGQSV